MYLKKSIVSPDILKKTVKMQRQYMVIAFVSKVFGHPTIAGIWAGKCKRVSKKAKYPLVESDI